MSYKIVSDSSSDMFVYDKAELVSVPLRIITDQKEYTDNDSLNLEEMVGDLLKYKGRSSTSCPSPDDFYTAFGKCSIEYVLYKSDLFCTSEVACIYSIEFNAFTYPMFADFRHIIG